MIDENLISYVYFVEICISGRNMSMLMKLSRYTVENMFNERGPRAELIRSNTTQEKILEWCSLLNRDREKESEKKIKKQNALH